MLFNDYIVIDNFFDHPEIIIEASNRVKYKTNKVKKELDGVCVDNSIDTVVSSWRGYRSELLVEKNFKEYHQLFQDTYEKVFSIKHQQCRFDFDMEAYFHRTTNEIIVDESGWHKDSSLFSGVIFLNYHPHKDGGTLLKVDNNIIKIENKFNRGLFFKSKLLHRPLSCFGDNLFNSRLTMVLFIYGIKIFSLG